MGVGSSHFRFRDPLKRTMKPKGGQPPLPDVFGPLRSTFWARSGPVATGNLPFTPEKIPAPRQGSKSFSAQSGFPTQFERHRCIIVTECRPTLAPLCLSPSPSVFRVRPLEPRAARWGQGRRSAEERSSKTPRRSVSRLIWSADLRGIPSPARGPHVASWKMIPRVKRSPLLMRLTPWRSATR